MDKVPLNAHYDAEMDIFSAWVRQPTEVFCVEPVEGIVLRLDANTDELVGYTVLDCRKRFAGLAPEEVTLPLVPAFALLPLKAQLRLLDVAFSESLDLFVAIEEKGPREAPELVTA
jgi:hypothetical protein